MSATREHTLPNGMTLLFAPQRHLHSIVLGLYLKGGALYENRQSQGVTHLIEHLCMRGVGGLDPVSQNAILDKMGSELQAATYEDALTFRLRTHPRFFDDALSLFLRFFADVPWTEAEINGARQVVLRQVEQEDGQPDAGEAAAMRWRRSGDGVWPKMGSLKSISEMTSTMIRKWQRSLFAPSNACIVLTGNFSSAMEDAVCQAFAEIPCGTLEDGLQQIVPQGFCMRDHRSDLIRDTQGGLARVTLSFDIDDETVFPITADVLCAITAQDNDSLLFTVMREQAALVPYIDSCIEEVGRFRRLVIRWAARQDLLEESLRTCFSLLQKLRVYVRPVRMDETRMQFTANLSFWEDDAPGMNELMGAAFISDDLNRMDLESRAQMYNDLTPQDLLNTAQSVFRPENLMIAISRDPEETGKNLRGLLKQLRDMLN